MPIRSIDLKRMEVIKQSFVRVKRCFPILCNADG